MGGARGRKVHIRCELFIICLGTIWYSNRTYTIDLMLKVKWNQRRRDQYHIYCFVVYVEQDRIRLRLYLYTVMGVNGFGFICMNNHL